MTTFVETPEMTAFVEALQVPRHKGTYDDQARMWDRLGARSPESFPPARHAGRPNTPDEILSSGGTRVKVKRICDGCGEPVGDATDAEVCAVIDGGPLLSVVAEHGCAR
jgi:hypothetical protein